MEKYNRSSTPQYNDGILAKVPPNAKELEEAILGAMLLESNAINTITEFLRMPECFYSPANVKVFAAAMDMQKSNRPIDMVTMVEELQKRGQLEVIGGAYYVAKLTNSVASTAHLEDYCKLVYEKFLLREQIRIANEMLGRAYEPDTDAFNLLNSSEASLMKLSTNGTTGAVQVGKVAMEEFAELDKLRVRVLEAEQNGQVAINGVPSGFNSIDLHTGGWQPSNLIILAARPSVGKTAAALAFGYNAAVKGFPTLINSLEMGKGQLAKRLLSSRSGIEMQDIRDGRLTQSDMDGLAEISVNLTDTPLYFDDTASMTIYDFRSKARRMVEKHGIKLIIVDYLQLMSGREKGMNREQEISTISRNLKILAKELNIPIIALSQLSRSIEQRGSKVPQLSDLRESGAIEQDADDVIFVYRPDYQEENVDPEMVGKTIFKWAKHRNGSLQEIALQADLSVQTFREITLVPKNGNYF